MATGQQMGGKWLHRAAASSRQERQPPDAEAAERRTHNQHNDPPDVRAHGPVRESHKRGVDADAASPVGAACWDALICILRG